MGTWGTSLYANDTARDIRSDYTELLKEGRPDEEAAREMTVRYRELIGDPDWEPIFWYALSDSQ